MIGGSLLLGALVPVAQIMRNRDHAAAEDNKAYSMAQKTQGRPMNGNPPVYLVDKAPLPKGYSTSINLGGQVFMYNTKCQVTRIYAEEPRAIVILPGYLSIPVPTPIKGSEIIFPPSNGITFKFAEDDFHAEFLSAKFNPEEMPQEINLSFNRKNYRNDKLNNEVSRESGRSIVDTLIAALPSNSNPSTTDLNCRFNLRDDGMCHFECGNSNWKLIAVLPGFDNKIPRNSHALIMTHHDSKNPGIKDENFLALMLKFLSFNPNEVQMRAFLKKNGVRVDAEKKPGSVFVPKPPGS